MPPPPLKSGEAPLGVASTAGSDVFNTRQHISKNMITFLLYRPFSIVFTLFITYPPHIFNYYYLARTGPDTG
jgi:hypothetical protein